MDYLRSVTPEEEAADEAAWQAWLSSGPEGDRLEQLDADLARRSPHRLSRWADTAASGRRPREED